jgi:hypothetical protein
VYNGENPPMTEKTEILRQPSETSSELLSVLRKASKNFILIFPLNGAA